MVGLDEGLQRRERRPVTQGHEAMGFHGPDGADEAIDDDRVCLFSRPPFEKVADGAAGLLGLLDLLRLRDMSAEAGDATRGQDARDSRRPKRRRGPHDWQLCFCCNPKCGRPSPRRLPRVWHSVPVCLVLSGSSQRSDSPSKKHTTRWTPQSSGLGVCKKKARAFGSRAWPHCLPLRSGRHPCSI